MAARAPDQLTGAPTPSGPVPMPLPDAVGHGTAAPRVAAHSCLQPSASPSGGHVAFICDRDGIPQLWVAAEDETVPRALDTGPDPVREVSWSPDGRWIAYTTTPGGSEHTRVLCVRPDGTGRRVLAGADPGQSAHLGAWTRDGGALAITVTEGGTGTQGTGAALADALDPGTPARPREGFDTGSRWTSPSDGTAGDGRTDTGRGGEDESLSPPRPREGAAGDGPPPDASHDGLPRTWPREGVGAEGYPLRRRLTAYLVDPDGVAPTRLLTTEAHASSLRVCDLTPDARFALVRRGPRGRREGVVLDTASREAASVFPVADGDPWIGRFTDHGGVVWLRSDADREFAALYAARLRPDGTCAAFSPIVARDGAGLELLHIPYGDDDPAALVWNVRGHSELELVTRAADPESARLPVGDPAADPVPEPVWDPAPTSANPPPEVAPATRRFELPDGGERAGAPDSALVPLPHEVVTRISQAGPGAYLVGLSGSQRPPGVWRVRATEAERTRWSARDDAIAAAGHRPAPPELLELSARDGLALSGWYHRAPDRARDRPGPCVVHLHGGPELQERPVYAAMYHELLARGIDVFAPNVRGSSGFGRSFVDADLGAGRFAAIDDVADCAAHAVLSGLADPAALAVMGHSYGGYLTLASLVRHPEVFRTGVTVCGMSSFATFFAGTEPWIAESAAVKYGHPERDRELLRELSPLTRFDALRVPFLAVHGEHDTNVPVDESRQAVRAARERGIPAELLVLREEGHDFQRAANRALFRTRAADWLQRHTTA
ncbi:alpha/beta fold hydrolase [Yinghuangia sp. ASG 101]|uniref:alpha/beta fold hydrolase n=1 Tax=Yinghuangia sp. ASG 101 TaxID=2896848 RepID=UPI001E423CF4|nr:alpha/beta fold hydrolase [Yinghuangia sp. ASG 101]UGQ12828.1 alpha/beta fold hydrolase [Yinghuangia sp. ASG 101]